MSPYEPTNALRGRPAARLQIELWNAGPGTSKSYMIKKMFRKHKDIIVKPFRAPNSMYPPPAYDYVAAHRVLFSVVGLFDTLEFTMFDFRAGVALAVNEGSARSCLRGTRNRTCCDRSTVGTLTVTSALPRPAKTCSSLTCPGLSSRFASGVPVGT